MSCGCGCGGEEVAYEDWGDTDVTAAEYQGRDVTLNKPFRTPGANKKFGVYTKNDSGNVVLVRFGDPNMEIKRDDPDRRKASAPATTAIHPDLSTRPVTGRADSGKVAEKWKRRKNHVAAAAQTLVIARGSVCALLM